MHTLRPDGISLNERERESVTEKQSFTFQYAEAPIYAEATEDSELSKLPCGILIVTVTYRCTI